MGSSRLLGWTWLVSATKQHKHAHIQPRSSRKMCKKCQKHHFPNILTLPPNIQAHPSWAELHTTLFWWDIYVRLTLWPTPSLGGWVFKGGWVGLGNHLSGGWEVPKTAQKCRESTKQIFGVLQSLLGLTLKKSTLPPGKKNSMLTTLAPH